MVDGVPAVPLERNLDCDLAVEAIEPVPASR
jgi:hypothetical protein